MQSETTMSLEMKTACEKCAAKLPTDAEAYICTFECTFCPQCSDEMNDVCPNCGGELVRRLRRDPNHTGV